MVVCDVLLAGPELLVLGPPEALVVVALGGKQLFVVVGAVDHLVIDGERFGSGGGEKAAHGSTSGQHYKSIQT